MSAAAAAWQCEMAMTLADRATSRKMRVVASSKTPWCVATIGTPVRRGPSSGPDSVWSWMTSTSLSCS